MMKIMGWKTFLAGAMQLVCVVVALLNVVANDIHGAALFLILSCVIGIEYNTQ